MLTQTLGLILVINLGSGLAQDYPRQRILQDQSCYYEPYRKQLTCQCDANLDKAFLLLRLAYNVRDIGQEIRQVQIVSCPDLLVSMDLRGVDPTTIPFLVRNSGVVTVDLVEMDGVEERTQLLQLSFNNVETVHLKGISLTQALQISAVNLKKLLITDSSFSLLGSSALSVSNTRRLEVRDSVFRHVEPRSIEVEGVKEVFVINNQFNINVIKVVAAKDGKRLHISCNRLLDEPISPECVQRGDPAPTVSSYMSLYYSSSEIPTTTTTTTTTVTSSLRPETTTQQERTTNTPVDLLMEYGISNDILIGIAAGVVLICCLLLFLVIWLCCCKNRVKNDPECVEEKSRTDANENINEEVRAELDLLLVPEEAGSVQLNAGPVESPSPDAGRPKFSSPVYLEEIHRNKIFAKQRSINSASEGRAVETEAALANGRPKSEEQRGGDNIITETPRRTQVRLPVRSISEILEFDDIEDECPGEEQVGPSHEELRPDKDGQPDRCQPVAVC